MAIEKEQRIWALSYSIMHWHSLEEDLVLTVKAPPATAGLFLCLTSARSKILFCDNIINVAQLEKSVGKHFLESFSN